MVRFPSARVICASLLAAAGFAGFAGLALADVSVPDLFTEHAVLQRSAATPIWGAAAPGEKVAIQLGTQTATTEAGADGRWRVSFDLTQSSAGPSTLEIRGRNQLALRDVLVGEVWLASGQSNMAAPLQSTTGAEEEIARAADPQLREYRVEGSVKGVSRGKWVVASPQTAGEFSAVGYYFAKAMRRETKRPVGIIQAARNGTEIEAWISPQAMRSDPELAAGSARLRQLKADLPAQITTYRTELVKWLRENQREDRPAAPPESFAAPGLSTEDWVPMTLPGRVTATGLPAAGALWVRKEIEIPAAMTRETVKILLGAMEGYDTVYWNGQKIAETPPQKFPGEGYSHYYVVPPELIKPGRATIAIRIFAPAAAPAFLTTRDRFWVGPLDLSGSWLAKAEYPLAPPTAAELRALPKPPKRFSGTAGSELFESLIAPLAPVRIAGFLWYQGESNVPRAHQYRRAFPLLIEDWRRHWTEAGTKLGSAPAPTSGNAPLPFYFCQLANHHPKSAMPGESALAELREAQTMALSVPNTEQAVLVDLGEADDIHPRNKRDVGERLACIALAKKYERPATPFRGPVYESHQIEAGQIRVRFRTSNLPLVARPLPPRYDVKTVINQTAELTRNSPGSELEGFALCGADRQWHWADARIDGDTVVVSSPAVPHPIAVRYAWADNPTCNLYNSAGLPAGPFRTDDFAGVTTRERFGLRKDD